MLLFVMIFVMAEVPAIYSLYGGESRDSLSVDKVPADSVRPKAVSQQVTSRDSAVLDSMLRSQLHDGKLPDSLRPDSLLKPDTAGMDSLQKAIWLHNKAVDDSLYADSVNRQRKNGIDAPVHYSASDSMVFEGETSVAHLFGKSNVKYENMDLTSEHIYIALDSSLVHATGALDTAGVKFGTPVFKMGSDTYETDTMAFNFKTKKGIINNAYTQQDDGYMTSEISKRNNNGEMYLYHGRYTTCDLPHPDFYFAMSRAKVRPGKDVVFGPTYLVVADVPLPFAVPYGFFPFTKSYSSGFIMPTYGDEI